MILLAATVSLVALAEPLPWSDPFAPSPVELEEAVAEAVALYVRERQDEFLEAAERGEDSEHIRVFQEDIDAGRVDLATLFRVGDAAFEHVFRAGDGLGAGAPATLRRVHDGVRGGLDTFSCAGCHSVGGPDGAGTAPENAFVGGNGRDVTTANVRNAPHVLGLGLVQALGVEMSAELARQRDDAIERAVRMEEPVRVELVSKGVSFGSLVARADGTVDSGDVQGVDSDLIVRPFGWKGEVDRLRRFVEEAARIHMGIQAHTLALAHRTAPDPGRLGDGPWYDPDADGVQRELEEGTLTASAVYLEMLEVPRIVPPSDAGLRDLWAHGSAVFDEVGCASCHSRELALRSSWWTESPDSTDGPGVTLNLITDAGPPASSLAVELFSDLRRHEMGQLLADPVEGEHGIPPTVFLTRPLWGLAETGPYLHDGRATTIRRAIELHGGEAAEARDAFGALPERDKRDLDVFLRSLSRAPHLRVPR